jgi:hypothetical protein
MHSFRFRTDPMFRLRGAAVAASLAGVALVSACTGAAQPSGSVAASNPTVAPTAVTTTASSSSPVAAAASPVAAAKVNANTASQDEVAAALAANGVPNASRWAVEVVEYRPYPTDDPSLAKLRQNLVKYNPAPGVTDEIVASLSL